MTTAQQAKMQLPALQAWCAALTERLGASPEDAGFLAENLAYAEARGITSHGFARLSIYADRIRSGGIDVAAQPEVVSDQGALVLIDGRNAMGSTTGRALADTAVSKAGEFGVGVAIARGVNHFGAAGHYASRIAEAGCIAIVAGNSDRVMCAPAGGSAVLGSNPLSIAVPLPREHRPQLDMATTGVAYGKILIAEQRGEDIPLGWAVDARGEPTTSATAALAGALLPAAGPKGFGLAFMIDALVAVAGAKSSNEAGALYGDPGTPQELGLFCLALEPGDGTAYLGRIDALKRAVTASGEGVLFPGEPELLALSRTGSTVTIEARTHAALQDLAERVGVPLPVPDGIGLTTDDQSASR